MGTMKLDAAAWAIISPLLDEVLDLPAAARARWLRALPDNLTPYLEILRSLLGHGAAADTKRFMYTLPKLDGMGIDDPGKGQQAGGLIGPYRLLRELGSGGMGAVWLAERIDGMIDRLVAVKLPHGSWCQAGLSERVERERAFLAALNHPHIARLYDAGVTHESQPYLVLEYVQGMPIDEYCRERQLDLRMRLILFIQVVKAVAHAHAQMILHRDLKPANILVTADGQPRLLDFGIAQLLADDRNALPLTEQYGRALTMDYASPEQVRDEPLSVAADIYGLGVILYELLTDQRPYRLRDGSRCELELAIKEQDPLRPSSLVKSMLLQRRMRGDLDAVILKALHKQPQRRYQTANEFAADLGCFIDGYAVQARPDSWYYRATKFVLRQPWPVACVVLALVALLVTTGMYWWFSRAATQQRNAAMAVSGVLQQAWLRGEALSPDVRADILATNALKPVQRAQLLLTMAEALMKHGRMAEAGVVLNDAQTLAGMHVSTMKQEWPRIAAARLRLSAQINSHGVTAKPD